MRPRHPPALCTFKIVKVSLLSGSPAVEGPITHHSSGLAGQDAVQTGQVAHTASQSQMKFSLDPPGCKASLEPNEEIRVSAVQERERQAWRDRPH